LAQSLNVKAGIYKTIYMAKYPEIILNGLQIKSLEKALKLSDALSVIEEECGIKEVKITLKNMFICTWIDLEQLNRTEMDLLLKDILTQLKQQENESK